jgi:hypothetical protein
MGTHIPPHSTIGPIIVSKKAQKIPKKNMNSENRNHIKAYLYNSIINKLCLPANPSIIISFLHIKIKYKSETSLNTA